MRPKTQGFCEFEDTDVHDVSTNIQLCMFCIGMNAIKNQIKQRVQAGP